MPNINKYKNPELEVQVLGAILQSGKDAFYDVSDVLGDKDFTKEINRKLWNCLKSLADEGTDISVDLVKIKAEELGFGKDFATPERARFLDLISNTVKTGPQLKKSGRHLGKMALIRNLMVQYQEGLDYLDNLDGKEKVSEILSSVESRISDVISGFADSEDIMRLSKGLDERYDLLLNSEPTNHVGIPTGFPLYDAAIGGGLLRAGVHVIHARTGVGKSYHSGNVAINIGKLDVPVLIMDRELIHQAQQDRSFQIYSGCPIAKYATSKFKNDPALTRRIDTSRSGYKNLPIDYLNISQHQSIEETLAFARKWIIKHVGLNEDGKANDCVLIYDYLKLLDAKEGKNFQEYQLMGFTMNAIRAFAIKYEVPILLYSQSNREKDVAASDRISWNATSLLELDDKDKTDEEMLCGWEHGNKKMYFKKASFGPGFAIFDDYINIRASLRPFMPGVTWDTATGLFEEGEMFSDVQKNAHVNPKKSQQEISSEQLERNIEQNGI